MLLECKTALVFEMFRGTVSGFLTKWQVAEEIQAFPQRIPAVSELAARREDR